MEVCNSDSFLDFTVECPFKNNTHVQILKEVIVSGPYGDFWKAGGGRGGGVQI